MCYQSCRYEDYSGECMLKRDAIPPMDAMCSINDTAAYNAMLQELVRDMWRTAMANMDLAERYAFAGEFNERMRELGIEVTP